MIWFFKECVLIHSEISWILFLVGKMLSWSFLWKPWWFIAGSLRLYRVMKGFPGSYKGFIVVSRGTVPCWTNTHFRCLHISEEFFRMQTQPLLIAKLHNLYRYTPSDVNVWKHEQTPSFYYNGVHVVYHNLIRTYFQHLSNMTQGLCRSTLYIMFSFSTAHIHNIYIYTYMCVLYVLSMLGRISFSAM